jgi:hypothetical protein
MANKPQVSRAKATPAYAKPNTTGKARTSPRKPSIAAGPSRTTYLVVAAVVLLLIVAAVVAIVFSAT